MMWIALLLIVMGAGLVAWSVLRKPKDLPEMCEVCSKRLAFNEAVFVTEVFTDDARLAEGRIEPGSGTSMTATYCKKHAPKENSNAA